MKTRLLIAGAAAAAIAASASADFSGFDADSYAVDADGNQVEFDAASFAVIDLFAVFDADNTHGFDNADSRLLNVFGATIGRASGGMFMHSDASGPAGSWSASLSLDIPGFANSATDSFVTIGGAAGATNSTALDPSFGAGSGGSIPAGAGWFNQNPPNEQGAVDGSLRTFIGRFVISAADAADGDSVDITASLSYNYGLGTGSFFADGSGSFAYIPAPGALALLGLGGLAARRRRA